MEHFIAFEDHSRRCPDRFYTFAFQPARTSQRRTSRALHLKGNCIVYGSMVPVGKGAKQKEWQHRGLWKGTYLNMQKKPASGIRLRQAFYN
jgi:elongator complex protein 3